ncbi:MAG: 4Fe-4S binding protein, partial [Deltaproteobacteria bacterium]|nr:4Fe-4S binding protein [Deltaproteobacteria bacterium]
EPSSAQEAKDMVAFAFDLSEKLQQLVIYRTTTRINHYTEVVVLGDIQTPITQGDFIKDPFNYVTVPAVSRNLHVKLLEKLETAETISETSEYNFITGDGAWGIVCNGVSYNYVSDAVKDLNMAHDVKILRVGFSHPMPRSLIIDFLKGCEKVLVVEEGEPFMEETIKAFAQEEGLTLPINGKRNDLLVRQCLATYFDVTCKPAAGVNLSDVPEIPQRPPSLCAGCSHRATFYAVNKATEGMETICPTDIGCYTLGFMPPLSAGDFLICMGASVGTSCGFSKVTDKKVISFIGDSTFFHSGIPGLINAVFNNHNFTLVILDNGITAMTGHQHHPGVDMKALSMEGYAHVSIEEIVKAVGVPHVSIIRPYRVKKSIESIKEALNFKGVSVVISKEGCTLFAKALKKPRGRSFFVSEKCKNHRDCINELACPAFFIEDNRVKIDPALCSGCTVCAQICPEHAILPLKDDA